MDKCFLRNNKENSWTVALKEKERIVGHFRLIKKIINEFSNNYSKI